MNLRPPGYEPDELPAALPRDIRLRNNIGAGDRGRTGTIGEDRRILSPVRLPVPPLRRSIISLMKKIFKKLAAKEGLEPSTLRLTAACSTIELLRNITLSGVPATRRNIYYITAVLLCQGKILFILKFIIKNYINTVFDTIISNSTDSYFLSSSSRIPTVLKTSLRKPS